MASLSYLRVAGGWVSILLCSGGLAACSSADAGRTGAAPGGAQDDALAGEKIDQGAVPRPEDITVEGTLNAHDFPLQSPVCEKVLCVSSAYAVAPSLDAPRSSVFVQVGFDSGIDSETFHRPALNLAVVVDRSGSMAGEKMLAVHTALSRLLDQLNEYDRLSIVTFNQSVEVLLPSTMVGDRDSIRALIPRIAASGTTNLALGLRAGFEQVDTQESEFESSKRVMVLTDAIANTGETDTQSFISIANANAAKEIGLTVFGVGTDLNQDLVLAISKLRGGNYLYLSDATRIATVFDRDFDYLVTPLAYDLRFNLQPAEGFRVAQVYGYRSLRFTDQSVSFEVPTVFLSRSHGAVVVRLEPQNYWPSGSAPLASLNLSYVPSSEAEAVSEATTAVYDQENMLDDQTAYYSQPQVRRTVAFVNAALGEKQACTQYWSGNPSAAIATLTRTQALLQNEASALEDLELMVEADKVEHLRQNMSGSSPTYYEGDYRSGDATLGACAFKGGSARKSAPLAWLLPLGLSSLFFRRARERAPRRA